MHLKMRLIIDVLFCDDSLRLGRLYRYTMEKYDVESLSSFISGWYKNVQAESIPLPKTPL